MLSKVNRANPTNTPCRFNIAEVVINKEASGRIIDPCLIHCLSRRAVRPIYNAQRTDTDPMVEFRLRFTNEIFVLVRIVTKNDAFDLVL